MVSSSGFSCSFGFKLGLLGCGVRNVHEPLRRCSTQRQCSLRRTAGLVLPLASFLYEGVLKTRSIDTVPIRLWALVTIRTTTIWVPLLGAYYLLNLKFPKNQALGCRGSLFQVPLSSERVRELRKQVH